MIDEPQPPENVRAVLPDGEEVPLECLYVGTDEAGQHHWRALAPVHVAGREFTVHMDALPAHTSLNIDVELCGCEPAPPWRRVPR